MPETPQLYLGLEAESGETATGFQGVLNQLRESATSTYLIGNEFERLMKQYLSIDPLYKERFTDVYLWKEWAALHTEYDGVDIGIDLVARERDGEYCAIQCKCFAEDTRVSKRQIDSFISASAGESFSKRILVHTGAELGPNVRRTIDPLGPDFQVIGYGHLASRPIDWPNLRQAAPEQLDYRPERFSLRPHQQEAFDDVINGFKDSDRGKLIMACGTGKTFTALRIAEEVAGIGGRVLYLVPSIGLFSQAMREWAEQQGVQHRFIGICSDTSTGKKSEDVPIQELEIPVTTDPQKISEALKGTDEDAMTVVFCTYHSLPIVEDAQDKGAPAFDIVLCDEAHRTTGIEHEGDDTSPFVLVHNADRIRAKKRLYMTATPRLYTEGAKAKAKAADHHIEIFSMDDPATYGPEFHRLPFSRAVEQDLLSDYKVVILTMYEPDAEATLQGYVEAGGKEINITDATKFVGSWRALQNPEGKSSDDESIKPLRRAIAFNNTIRNSKRLAEYWNPVIESAIEQMPEDQRPAGFQCETQHVDGQHNAFDRKTRIEWLKGNTPGACRLLSNARCLSEGIDVPALDAVLFMTPRNSHVDIVQAVVGLKEGTIMEWIQEDAFWTNDPNPFNQLLKEMKEGVPNKFNEAPEAKKGLSDDQVRAIPLIIEGKTDAQVGEALGKRRETINRWRNQDEHFIKELQAAREAYLDAQITALSATTPKVITVLQDLLDSEDEKIRMQAATHLLKVTALSERMKYGL